MYRGHRIMETYHPVRFPTCVVYCNSWLVKVISKMMVQIFQPIILIYTPYHCCTCLVHSFSYRCLTIKSQVYHKYNYFNSISLSISMRMQAYIFILTEILQVLCKVQHSFCSTPADDILQENPLLL